MKTWLIMIKKLRVLNGYALSLIISFAILSVFSGGANAQTANSAANDGSSISANAIVAPVKANSNTSTSISTRLRKNFNHLTTGFAITGAHLGVACETCHVNGNLKGTPRECAGCHSVGRLITATPKTIDHIKTTKACDACHTSTASFQSYVMDHTGLTEPCSSCHYKGNTAIKSSGIMSSTHVVTNEPCENCHKNTTSFTGIKFDHAGRTSGCSACHGDVPVSGAQGKPANHIATNGASCEKCHAPDTTSSFSNFLGAAFDHSTTTATCTSCHTGQLSGVINKPAGHVPYPDGTDCNVCHSTSTSAGGFVFVPPFKHSAVSSLSCVTCHDTGKSFTNVKMVTKPATHIVFPAATECSACHSTNVGGFVFAPPMNHAAVSSATCASCHDSGKTFANVNMVTKPTGHVPYPSTLDCNVCHTSTSIGSFPSWSQGDVHAAAGGARCDSCHDTGKTFTNVTIVTKPAGHITYPAAKDCNVCHSSTSIGSFPSWNLAAVHPAVSDAACASCHDTGKTFTNVSMVTKPATAHIPVGALACDLCHSKSSTNTGGFVLAAPFMNHSIVSGTACATCHDIGKSYPAVVVKPSNHIDYTAGTGCDNCHTASNTSNYTTFFGATGSHIVQPAGTCLSCHGGGTPGGATSSGARAQSLNHIPTALDCSTCHTWSTFTWTTSQTSQLHTAVSGTACATCHNSGLSFDKVVTKPGSSHIPIGSLACDTCHTSTNVGGFAAPNWSLSTVHNAVSASSCATCHDTGKSYTGTTMVTKPSNHILYPANTDCNACHASTSLGSFALWDMNSVHTVVNGTACATCHDTGKAFQNVALKTKPSGHIPYSGGTDCYACHTSTSKDGFVFVPPMNHAAVSGLSCATCHDTGKSFLNVTLVTKSATTHIPYSSTVDCQSCHTNTNSGGFVYTSSTMNHAAVIGTPCATCHDTGKSFLNVTLVTKSATTHIPYPSAIDCNVCHTSTSAGGFVYTSTMNHTAVAGTTCATCHDTGNSFLDVALVTKPTNHIPYSSTVDCNVCHTSTNVGSFPSWSLNTIHTAVTGAACATCHDTGKTFDNVTMVTKSATTHIPYPAATDCAVCHTSNSTGGFVFTSAMNHAAVSTLSCSGCHDTGKSFFNVTLVTKPAGHIDYPISADCNVCHNSSNPGGFPSWTLSSVHTAVSGAACATCHDTGKTFTSVTMVTKNPSIHIPVGSVSCESCHSSSSTAVGGFETAWTMGTDGHNLVSGTCASCHDIGSPYTGVVLKSASHIMTSAACDTCHTASNTSNFANFLGATGSHNSNPLNSTNPTCLSCHGGGTAGNLGTGGGKNMIASHIPIGSLDCGSCHSFSSFTTWTTSQIHTQVSGTACATCHASTRSYAQVVVESTSIHVPIGSVACESCHSPASTSVGNFATSALPMGTAGHTAVSGTSCATCHDTGLTYTGVVNKPANHITYPTTSGCDSCHTSSNTGGFSNFLGATGSHASNPVPSQGATCATCHGGGTPGGMTATNAKAVALNHIPFGTLDCAACHSYSTFTTWTAPTVHTQVTGTACSTCHDAGKTYASVVVKPVNHIVVTTACDTCHTSTTTPGGFATWTMGSTGHDQVKTATCASCHDTGKSFQNVTLVTKPAGHIVYPSTTDCNVCHTSIANGSFSAWTGNLDLVHTAVSSSTCASCHASGLTFTKATMVTQPSGHIAYPSTTDCKSCHTTTTVGSFASWTLSAVHTAVSGTACVTCHDTGKIFTNANMVNKPATAHIPSGTLACDTCHSAANIVKGGFVLTPPAMTHSAVTGTACATCHDTGKTYPGVVVKSTAHIPTGSITCESCHSAAKTSLGDFASGWAMGAAGHALVSATSCATCHDLGTSFPGVKTKTSTHLAYTAGTGCESCHTAVNTSNYANFLGATGAHTAAPTGTCISCHGGGTPGTSGTGGGKNMTANHIPTGSLDCGSCHSWSSFTTWTNPSIHTSVSGTACSTCHGIGKNYSGVVVESASIHVPIGNITCDSCHSTTNTSVGAFALSSTGWQMGTAGHALVTASSCATCHDLGTSFTGVATKSATHLPYTAGTGCESCHTSANTSGYANFLGATGSHTVAPTGSCTTCHAGTGSGKQMTAGHIPIGSVDCGTCHSWSSFTTWTVPAIHTAVSATPCATCHDAGKTYTGVLVKPTTGHAPYPTTTDCKSCHTVTTLGGFAAPNWTLSAVHTAVSTATCTSCHDTGKAFTGTTMLTKPAGHIPYATTVDCVACHTATTVGSFPSWSQTGTHAAVSGTTCVTCHATGKTYYNVSMVTLNTSIHIPSGSVACESCHTSTVVTTGGFATSALPMVVAGHNAVSSTVPLCATCHGAAGSAYTGVTVISSSHLSSAYYPAQDCGTNCHTPTSTSNYSVGGFKLLNMAAPGPHTGITTTCNSCHNDIIATGKATYSGHMATTAECYTCHTIASTNGFTSFKGGVGSHATNPIAAGGTCYSCHGGGIPGGIVASSGAKAVSVGHIPTGTVDCATSSCHTYTKFSGGNMTSGHAAVAATRCDACHNGSYTTQGTVGAQAVTSITNHIPTKITGTLDCSTCHKGTPVVSASGFLTGESMNHNAAQGGASPFCVDCHLSGVSYLGTMRKFSHKGASATATKDCSSSGCHKPRGSKGTVYSVWD